MSYINGLNADGTVGATNYWHDANGITAFKFGPATAGTGATITYDFLAASNFSDVEKATLLEGMAMWESVANVHFVAASTPGSADLQFRRGSDGNAYESGPTSIGSGATLGQHTGQTIISIDTSVFSLGGSFDLIGGYGVATAIHEIGHALGLGHGGNYNGVVNPSTQQFSAYDFRLYTTMSYIGWYDTDAKYAASYPVTGTDWGIADGGLYYRSAPHTVMLLDILAIQQLYGAPVDSPLAGGTIYGFNTNIAGPLRDFFDFTVNTHPVVTLFNTATGNTLDVSGYSVDQIIHLAPGHFSSIGGLTNNLGIAFGTAIETAIGGSGADLITGNGLDNVLIGGAGDDVLIGGGGNDTLEGGLDNDRLVIFGSPTLADGGDGSDTLVIAAGTTATIVDGQLVAIERISVRSEGAIDLGQVTDTVGNIRSNSSVGLGAIIHGTQGADTIRGGHGSDALDGGNGNDRIIAGDGGSTITGGAGGDRLVGGDNIDTFVFTNLADTSDGTVRDRILDFSHAQGDRIDLSVIDPDAVADGDQAFTFIGTSAFTGAGGSDFEVRLNVAANGVQVLQFDLDHDGQIDASFIVHADVTLTGADFIL